MRNTNKVLVFTAIEFFMPMLGLFSINLYTDVALVNPGVCLLNW